jgi:hypothetical protein
MQKSVVLLQIWWNDWLSVEVFIFDIDERLGNNGVGEIKVHPFFIGINWQKIGEK